MKKATIIVIIILNLIGVVSCKNNQKEVLSYSYYTFNVPASCVSIPSIHKDSILYVGMENGNITRINTITKDRKTILTNFDNRIYDIEEDSTYLWLGVRNKGLVRYSKKDGETKGYTINVPIVSNNEQLIISQTTEYASYDIEIDISGNIYLATSSGVYGLKNKDEGLGIDTLTLLFRPINIEKYYFGVNQIKILGDSLFCATDSGLIVLNNNLNRQYKDLGTKNQISHISFDKDTVYASADSKLLKKWKENFDEYQSFAPLDIVAYFVDSSKLKGRWEIGSTEINYYNNQNIKRTFTLPERISKSYKNYLCSNDNYVFLLQGMKVYSFAIDQELRQESKNITVAHTKDNVCYFISDDRYLYSLPKATNKATCLGEVGGMENNENIIQMLSSDSYLWIITDKEGLYKIKISKTPSVFEKIFECLKKTYTAQKEPLKDDFKRIFYCEDDSSLYVGSRYKLFRISDPENKHNMKSISILNIDKKERQNDLYVTDIFSRDAIIYISSLNHGLIRKIEEKDSLEVENDTLGSIYKSSIVSGDLLLKTSKGLFCKGKGMLSGFSSSDKTKLIHVMYDQKLSANYRCAYIGYHGVGTIVTSDSVVNLGELSRVDLIFNKAAIADGVINNTVLLGSKTGLYEYNLVSGELKYKELAGKSQTSKIIMIVTVSLLLFAILIYFIIYKLKIRRLIKYGKSNIGDKQIDGNIAETKIREEIKMLIEKFPKGQIGLPEKLTAIEKQDNVNSAEPKFAVLKELEEYINNRDREQRSIIECSIESIKYRIGEIEKHQDLLNENVDLKTNYEEIKRLVEGINSSEHLINIIKKINKIDSCLYNKLPLNSNFDFSHVKIDDNLKNEIDEICKAFNSQIGDTEKSTKVKDLCDKFLQEYMGDFKDVFPQTDFSDVKAHVIVLYYLKNISPNDILKLKYLSNKFTNSDIGKYRAYIHKTLHKSFCDNPKLKDNVLFTTLYERVKRDRK